MSNPFPPVDHLHEIPFYFFMLSTWQTPSNTNTFSIYIFSSPFHTLGSTHQFGGICKWWVIFMSSQNRYLLTFNSDPSAWLITNGHWLVVPSGISFLPLSTAFNIIWGICVVFLNAFWFGHVTLTGPCEICDWLVQQPVWLMAPDINKMPMAERRDFGMMPVALMNCWHSWRFVVRYCLEKVSPLGACCCLDGCVTSNPPFVVGLELKLIIKFSVSYFSERHYHFIKAIRFGSVWHFIKLNCRR